MPGGGVTIPPGRPNYTSTSITVGPWNVKTLSEGMSEVSTIYGVEFYIQPIEPKTTPVTAGYLGPTGLTVPSQRPQIGTFVPGDTAAGLIGSDVSEQVIFEYGTTNANVASYSLNVDRQQMANQIYVPRVGFPEPGRVGAAPTVTSFDSTSKGAAGTLEAWVDPGEIELQASRQALADQHKTLRKGPRRLVNFQPVKNSYPEAFVDYKLGDFVRFRAFAGDILRFDVTLRIWSMQAAIDDAGNEAVTISTFEDAP